MRLNRKIAIAAGAATLTIGGVAGLTTPDAADKGRQSIVEHNVLR